ncbi:inositol monophosphatase family protein [Bombella pollinis]|uniref:Inositol monophosphatase family protein n=1 Tax=Bombella pollinis TaxID=2967337 RepID=A0ABT3WQC8_9PROT|nr:inositol monophosphatase family protein [Bombella pollinis]MCX5619843.1 inositol monophosphatase family protein [Bombella pollinis]
MSHPAFSDYLPLAQQCAEAARRVILPYFRQSLAIHAKEDDSPVTKADQEAEAAMRALLTQHVPHHAILGEEAGHSGQIDNEWLWVLDPIDGTRAFVTGRPSFTSLISLFYKGRPVLGIIDQPITNERWIGVEGAPSRYDAPHMPGHIGTCQHVPLHEAELSCTAPEIFRPAQYQCFQKLQKQTRRTSWGGDAYAYGLLCLGHIDIIAEDTLKPWDWGPLLPIITGAGGCVTDWAGNALTLESDGTILACANPTLHQEAIEALSS